MATCPSCGAENRDGARFCDACGAELTAAAPLREVRKVVTVLFADVAGFTAAGERLDPEALRRLQSRYFEEARAALEGHGATVEKFIGDAVMAVFGIPQVHEDDALRAVRAALELREAVAPLEVRIGVNTGEVVAGRGDALVTGDAVNVAARLEQSAEPGTILVGEPTYRLVRDVASAEPVAAVDAKGGKAEPVAAYRSTGCCSTGPRREAWARPSWDASKSAGCSATRSTAQRASAPVISSPCSAQPASGSRGSLKSSSRTWAAAPRSCAAGASHMGTGSRSGRSPRCSARLGPRKHSTGPWSRAHARRRSGRSARRSKALPRTGRSSPSSTTSTGPRPRSSISSSTSPTGRAMHRSCCSAWPGRSCSDVRSGWAGGKLNATSLLLEPLTERECELLLDNLLGRAGLDAHVRARVQAQAGLDACRRAQELVRSSREPGLVLAVGRWINVAMIFGPTPPEVAIPELERTIAEGGRHPEAEATNAYAAFEAMLGHFDDARRWLARTIALNEEFGLELDALAVSSHVGGFIESLAGDLEAAEARHRAALEGLERMGELGYLSTTAAMLARVLCSLGRYDEAAEFADLSERAAASDDLASQMEFRAGRALVLAHRGEAAEAERVAREAIELGDATDYLNHRGDAYLALAEVLQVAGRVDEAAEAIAEAARLFELKGNVVQERKARELLAGGDGHG